ncbi:MAG: DUF1580 domain-containing protein [Pirellulales bacterium]
MSYLNDTDQYLSPAEASKRMPGRPSLASIYRWMSNGCRGVKLESVVVGAKRLIAASAIDRFIEQSTAAARYGTPPGTKFRTTAQRERAIAKVEAELTRAGI